MAPHPKRGWCESTDAAGRSIEPLTRLPLRLGLLLLQQGFQVGAGVGFFVGGDLFGGAGGKDLTTAFTALGAEEIGRASCRERVFALV